MLKSDITFDKIARVFIPGVTVSIFLWYIYRDFLGIYFPVLARDIEEVIESKELISRFVIIFMFSFVLGYFIDQMSDVFIVGNFTDESSNDKSLLFYRKFMRMFMRIFIFRQQSDPRVWACDRYYQSNKGKTFQKLCEDWVFGIKYGDDTSNSEKILVHQHLVTRARVIGLEYRDLVDKNYESTQYVLSIFSSVFLIWMCAIAKYPLYYILSDENLNLKIVDYIQLVLILYAFLLIANYIIIRRFRHFCLSIVTLCMHIHSVEDAE